MVATKALASAWLEEDAEPVDGGLVVRKATVGEVLAVYGRSFDNIVAAIDGVPVMMASLCRMEGRLWAHVAPMHPVSRQHRLGVMHAFRAGLRDLGEDLWVVARDKRSERMMALLGLVITDESMGTQPDGSPRRVWRWISG